MARTRDGVCTTRCQLFNTEMTKNENKLRMRWFVKNRQLLLDNLRDDRLVSRAQEMKNKLEENHLQRLREYTENVELDKPLRMWRPRKQDGSNNLDVMRPVDPATRAILYESGVESYTTGHNYLHERYKDKPENRFYYPNCTSWLHGWHLADYPPVPATKVGRTTEIRDSFYRRHTSSLQRDPDSQRQCQTTNAKNFNEIFTY